MGALLFMACGNALLPSNSEPVSFTDIDERAVSGGFKVSGASLLDANGKAFVMRGVNYPHAWYTDKYATAMKDIAATGANTVRVVLSNGTFVEKGGKRWNKTPLDQVEKLIDAAKKAKLITVLEVHDTTGYNEEPGACSLDSAFNYWKEIKTALIGQEAYVILNIGNEPFGNNMNKGDPWVAGHEKVIKALRKEKIKNVLMIDGANWGQDWSYVMRDLAGKLLAVDSQLIFSVHMYEVYQDFAKIDNYVKAFIDNKRCLVIGEFGADHRGKPVDEANIMKVAQTRGVGYLAWSWSGNSSDLAALDMVYDFNGQKLTPWGKIVIDGTNGIRKTSKIASIFSGSSGGGGSGGSTGTSSIRYDFEGNTQGWIGKDLAGGPWTTSEWKANGSTSLKADVQMSANKVVRLLRTANDSFSGKKNLRVKVRNASWGTMGSGMKARLYLKTGANWTWKDSGWVNINSGNGTTLTVSLSGMPYLTNVREIGIEYQCAANSSGQTAVYADAVSLD
jgi:mannan endo-1,4-beta-mannosidase